MNQRSLKKDLGNRLQSCNKCHLSPGAILGCPGGFRVCMITAHPSFTLRTPKVIFPKYTINTDNLYAFYSWIEVDLAHFFLKKRDIFFTFMLIDFLLTLVLQFFRKSIMKKYIK